MLPGLPESLSYDSPALLPVWFRYHQYEAGVPEAVTLKPLLMPLEVAKELRCIWSSGLRSMVLDETVTIEPWRAAAFPVVKDLMVDRSAFDAIVQSGGFITADTGAARDANEILVPKPAADSAMDAAGCIGCGACVAACPNGAGQLFTSAKLAHLNLLPQGQAERYKRTEDMVETMELFFGSCTNYGECQEACPKEIPIDFIAMMNRDFLKSKLANRKLSGQKR